ncbi:MAG: NAD(P)H-hydrate dehydratase [Candidatus Omnitrophica bacterium]|nr:NAD(P)H-hydrate dehydratase [Candidatus Omnitrophota bacterium]
MARKHIDKIPSRRENSHKGDFGHVLVIAGSFGMTGAACLCSRAALRSGAGLVTCAVRESLSPILEMKLTEVMTLPIPENKRGQLDRISAKKVLDFAQKCEVVAIGPGLGLNSDTKKFVQEILKKVNAPVVIDADAINALDGKLSLIQKRKHLTVITPHPGEMANLIKKEISYIELQRVEVAKKVALESGALVCLKGHNTVVASSDGQVYVNDTGNSGMATAGAGDVLTGIIASFIGQGIDGFGSCVSAVYLHGLAGDLGAAEIGPFSLIASDLIEYLPKAFQKAGIV